MMDSAAIDRADSMTRDVLISKHSFFLQRKTGEFMNGSKTKGRVGNGRRDKEEERKTSREEVRSRRESGDEHWNYRAEGYC